MDYYKKRMMAQDIIKKLIATNKMTKDGIAFEIQERFGYAKRFSISFIEDLKNNDYAEEIMGVMQKKNIIEKKGENNDSIP